MKDPNIVYEFIPEHDITVFELAMVLQKMELTISDKVYLSMPSEVRRHFTIPEDKKQ